LTVGDVNSAAWRLLHCGELIWAVEVNRCSENPDPRITDIFHKYAIFHGCAADIFQHLSNESKRALAPMVPFETEDQRNAFYARHGLKTTMDYLTEAKNARGLARTYFLVLAGRVTEAATHAIQCLRPILAAPSFDFSDAYRYIEGIQDSHVHGMETDPIWKQVIALSYYFAVYNAMWRRYAAILPRLIAALEAIIAEARIEWLEPRLAEAKVAAALGVAAAKAADGRALAERWGMAEQLPELRELRGDAVADGGSTVKSRATGVTPVDLAASGIMWGTPSGVDTRNGFMLEDEKTTMPWDEALMWFEVTPFSPLWTHQKLMVY
jgi:hypothetical protein